MKTEWYGYIVDLNDNTRIRCAGNDPIVVRQFLAVDVGAHSDKITQVLSGNLGTLSNLDEALENVNDGAWSNDMIGAGLAGVRKEDLHIERTLTRVP